MPPLDLYAAWTPSLKPDSRTQLPLGHLHPASPCPLRILSTLQPELHLKIRVIIPLLCSEHSEAPHLTLSKSQGPKNGPQGPADLSLPSVSLTSLPPCLLHSRHTGLPDGFFCLECSFVKYPSALFRSLPKCHLLTKAPHCPSFEKSAPV